MYKLRTKILLLKKTIHFITDDNSSSEDEEITWTCLQRSQKRTRDTFDHNNKYYKADLKEDDEEEEDRQTPARNDIKPTANSNKPPRFANANSSVSLDRRQRSRSQSHRRERDSKSRSTHSLKEKDLNEKILIGNNLSKDNNNSSSSCSNRRMSPITWEIPPPPPFHPWDQHYFKHHMASREDLRSMEYYRRPCDPYRLGSCQELYHHPSTLSLTGGGYDYPNFYPPPPCCSNHYYSAPYQVIGLELNDTK